MRLLLLTLLCAGACALITEAFTGMACPLPLRLHDPGWFCVSPDGLPQKGCRLPVGVYAYDLQVIDTVIDGCFLVRWFWKI
jgi:hypothetical protein